MPNEVVPITGLDQIGLIEDIPPVSLPPNAFSDCRNVRFRDGAVIKMEGDVNIMPYIQMADADILRYVAWWPNPNLAFANLGYYLIIIEQQVVNVGLRDVAYLVKVNELGRYTDDGSERLLLTPAVQSIDPITNENVYIPEYKGLFRPGGNWQHTFFQGGFSLIINNGLEAPRFVLDSEDNTDTANVPFFADLPNWESYADTPEYQALVSDTLPSGEMIDVNTLRVTSGVIRDFGDFLVAGDLVERANIVDMNDPSIIIRTNAVLRALPGIVRSSDIAMAGAIPQNWNPFNTAVNTADEFTITNDGIVQDFVELQGNMFIYSNSSISIMSRTGNATVPLSVRPVTTAYGTLTTDAVLEYDGRHFVVGAQDIYIFGGHPGSIQSVGDAKVREAFYNRLNPIHIDNVFLLRYQQKDEIWICFPNKESTGGLVNEVLIWNYRKNNWTKRDVQNVVSGDIAPIPGGGLPLAELIFTGEAGNNAEITAGTIHTNSLSAAQSFHSNHVGVAHQYEIRLNADFPLIDESTEGTPVHFITFDDTFATGDPGLTLTAQGRTSGVVTDPTDPLGRFLQVPDVGSSPATTRDFNFTVPLTAGIGPYDPTSSLSFAQQITLPVFLNLITTDPENFTWEGVTDYQDNAGLPADVIAFFDDFVAGGGILPAYDQNAPITLHLTDDDRTFVLQYEEIPLEVLPYTSFVSFGNGSIFFDEDQVQGRTPDLRRGDDDRVGIFALEQREPAKPVGELTGIANTFYFDFTTLIDQDPTTEDPLSNYVFFFRGASNGDGTYQSLPDGVVKFAATYNGSNPMDTADGGDRTDPTNPSSGGDRTDTSNPMAGQRRGNPDFSANTIVDAPLFGTYILSQLRVSSLEVTQFPLQVWVPDGIAEVTEVNLVAYLLPPVSDGVFADTNTGLRPVRNIFIENFNELAGTLPPVLEFSGIRQLFNETTTLDNCGWVRGPLVEDGFTAGAFNFTIALAHQTPGGIPDPITPEYRAEQRAAFASTIERSFFQVTGVPLRTINTVQDGQDWVITVESNLPVPFELNVEIGNAGNVAAGEADITVADPFEGTTGRFINPEEQAAHLTIRQIRQGVYPYAFGQAASDEMPQPFIPPRILIRHTDPEILFFNRDTGPFNLITADTGDDAVTPAMWGQTILERLNTVNVISSTTPNINTRNPQWVGALNGTDYEISTTAIIYDETQGDQGVEVPDLDPATGQPTYVSFPAERLANNFEIEFCFGSGVAEEAGMTAEVARITSMVTQAGSYATNNTPSYVALRVSDSTVLEGSNGQPAGQLVFLFSISPGADIDQTIQELQLQLDRRAPRLQALVSGTGRLSIQPANYTDLANFVLEFVINNPESIDRMRQLLNADLFTQDEFNPKPLGDLPERVQFGRDENMMEVDNSRGFINPSNGSFTLASSQDPTFEFDVLRPWPRTQINFTLEYPIFAATRLFPDGVTTNKVIAADIGFSRPAFMRPEVPRIEDNVSPSLVQIREGTQDAPEDYESFIERVQQGLAPEFTTEMLASVALWTDGSTQSEFRGPFAYNNVQLRVTTSDAPGDPVDLSTTGDLINTLNISEDYKVDVRQTGRFVNWRITDNIPLTNAVINGKPFNKQTLWRLSGLQFDVSQAGRR